jgi:hypothetical protein
LRSFVLASATWVGVASGQAPTPSSEDDDVACDESVQGWAKRASAKQGRSITAMSCPGGSVRFAVADAGCDFEVVRGNGFQLTKTGSFAVSPIVNLEWSEAPPSMKSGLDVMVGALDGDSSLVIPKVAMKQPTAAPPNLLENPWFVYTVAAFGMVAAASTGFLLFSKKR